MSRGTIQKGQYHAHEDLYQGDVEIEEASSYHKQFNGYHSVNPQERPKEPPLNKPSPKFKGSYYNSPGRFQSRARNISSKWQYGHLKEPAWLVNDTQPRPGPSCISNLLQLYLNIQRVSEERVDIESCHVNLPIVETLDQQPKDKDDLTAHHAVFHRMHSYEETSKDNMKAPIPLEKLLNKRKLRDGERMCQKRSWFTDEQESARPRSAKSWSIYARANYGETSLMPCCGSHYVSWKDLEHATSNISCTGNTLHSALSNGRKHLHPSWL
ncbi:hypothetical protein BGZ79_003574, partial [Entomortierella chlamydospora]